MNWIDRFNAFALRKERKAIEAQLAPFRTELDQPPPGFTSLGNSSSRRLFDGDFHVAPQPLDVPATSLVFVQSKDGNTGARDPAALGGGETDQHLIYEGLSRVAADAVFAGAETVRGGDVIFSVWHPELVALRGALGLPRHPTEIIATLRGLPIEQSLLFNVPDLPVVVLTVRSCADLMRDRLAERPWVRVIEMSSPSDVRPAFQRLRDMGITRISCIGGRTIARTLMDAQLVQDLYLTTSARNGGEPNTPLTENRLEGQVIVRKHGTGPDEGVVFEHIVLPVEQR